MGSCPKSNSCESSCDRKKRKRRRRKKACGSCKAGKVTPNPFFNYLRVLRKKHCDWSAVKVAVKGARRWCSMSSKEKDKYREMACKAPKYKSKGCKRKRSRSSRRSSCSQSKCDEGEAQVMNMIKRLREISGGSKSCSRKRKRSSCSSRKSKSKRSSCSSKRKRSCSSAGGEDDEEESKCGKKKRKKSCRKKGSSRGRSKTEKRLLNMIKMLRRMRKKRKSCARKSKKASRSCSCKPKKRSRKSCGKKKKFSGKSNHNSTEAKIMGMIKRIRQITGKKGKCKKGEAAT